MLAITTLQHSCTCVRSFAWVLRSGARLSKNQGAQALLNGVPPLFWELYIACVTYIYMYIRLLPTSFYELLKEEVKCVEPWGLGFRVSVRVARSCHACPRTASLSTLHAGLSGFGQVEGSRVSGLGFRV